ncbi:MAG: hypothetical protein L0211_02225 [Planctomycetaceae bacterium]|nr:hypothetical protein [Planctomycetaceae bacterium]
MLRRDVQFVALAIAGLFLSLVALQLLTAPLRSQEAAGTLVPGTVTNQPPSSTVMELPASVTGWYRNPDGSCVQCSIGMVGCHNNLPAWSTVLWDTDYGRAQRGGSGPNRVASYARARRMRIYNVTGEPTFAWMAWAAKTNRFAAIGAGGSHFQTLYGRSPAADRWFVCNNNSTGRVDEYTPEAFRRLHLASGPWIVIPDEPASAPPPRIVAWWQ